MRILALRGKNLASLESFDIDFTAEPLDSAGLFAITGPTGAGKSTLLDAMSLALFDTVPRLGAAAKVAVGREDRAISQDDVRSIMRHGSTTASAECDFLARDGNRYRAKWEVSRAKTGKLKAREMSLVNLDTGEGGADKLTEIKPKIAAIVGLSAEQFGRAVVLAQGEFEAFIKAGPDERSELLEKLTGTEIYTKIGRLAGTKANALLAEKKGFEVQLQSKEVLDEDQRAALDDEHRSALENAQQKQAEIALLEKSQAWEQRGTDLAVKRAAAEKARDEANAAQNDAAPRREALERHKRAAKLIPAWRAMAAAQQQASEATRRADLAAEALPAAEQSLTVREKALTEADETFAKAGQALAEAKPALTAARALDTQIASATTRISAITVERDALGLEVPKLDTAKDRTASDLANAEREIAHHDAWLAENEAQRFVAQKEGELRADLAKLDAMARDIALASKAQDDQLDRIEDQRVVDKQARGDRDEAANLLEAVTHRLETAKVAVPSAEIITEARQRREALAALPPLVNTAKLAAESHADLAASAEALSSRHDETVADLAGAESEKDELTALLPALEAEAKGARVVANRTLAAESDAAVNLRQNLTPGEPCPVCGSADHAIEMLEAALAAPAREAASAADEADERHRDAQLKLHGLGERIVSLSARRDDLAAELEKSRTRLAQLADSLGKAVEARDAAAQALGFDTSAEDFDTVLAQAAKAANTLCNEHERLRQEADTAQGALNAARVTFDRARTAADLSAEALRKQGDALVAAESLVRQQERDSENLVKLLDRHFSPLPGHGGDWRALPDRTAWLTGLASEWRDHEKARKDAQDALPELRRVRDEAGASHGKAAERLRQLGQDQDTEGETLTALKTDRATLLNGEPADLVEGRLSDATKSAETAREEARTAFATAKEALAQAATAATAATEERDRLNDLASEAETTFRTDLAPSRLDAETVAKAAEQAEGFEAEEASLQALHDALLGARTTLAERQADLDAHLLTEAPGPVGEELTEALAQARPALDEAEEAVQVLRSKIDYDDRQRASTEDLRAEIEAWKERSAVWLALGEMIGDNDGKKFRKFAQSLTLDRLLEAANMRLAELKPRYMLERATGGEMAIQVIDNDMAGEVRGLHNLSGGERFLVSLALALGLAEMSTGRGIRIESLFIDEGFGALDPASLGQALAVLEHLHATGRRVGVISHVEELKERIPVKIEVTPVSPGKSEVSVALG